MNPRATAKLNWPAIGLAVQIVASEFQPNSVGASTVVRYTLFAVAAVLPLFVVGARSLSLPVVLRRAPLNWLTAFLVWTCIAAVWSIDPVRSLQPAIWMTSLAIYSTWYVTQIGWLSFRRVAAITLAAFTAACFVDHYARGEVGRVVGFSFGATNLGFLGGVAVVLAVSLPRATRADRTVRIVVTAVGLTSVVASSARTVALGLVLLGVYGAFKRRGRSSALIVSFVAAAAVIISVTAANGGLIITSRTPDGTDFIEERNGLIVLNHSPGSSEYTTATGRTQVWSESLDEVAKRPLFGWGTGSGERLFVELAAQGRLQWLAYGAHNALLGVLLAQGAVGLALFLAAAVSYWSTSRRTPDTARGALMILLAINGISESLFDTGRVSTMILAAAFAMAANDAAQAVTERRRAAHLTHRRRSHPVTAGV